MSPTMINGVEYPHVVYPPHSDREFRTAWVGVDEDFNVIQDPIKVREELHEKRRGWRTHLDHQPFPYDNATFSKDSDSIFRINGMLTLAQIVEGHGIRIEDMLASQNAPTAFLSEEGTLHTITLTWLEDFLIAMAMHSADVHNMNVAKHDEIEAAETDLEFKSISASMDF